MGFNLLDFLTAFLGGFNITDLQGKIQGWRDTEGAKYPDAKDEIDAMADWLLGVLTEAAPNLDPKSMALTVKAIATSIVNGTAGVDPDAWMFG